MLVGLRAEDRRPRGACNRSLAERCRCSFRGAIGLRVVVLARGPKTGLLSAGLRIGTEYATDHAGAAVDNMEHCNAAEDPNWGKEFPEEGL